MADRKPNNTKEIEPPIKDTILDGVLSSKEILAQLRTEEEEGAKRTPNEKVHGVLEVIMRGKKEYLPEVHGEYLLAALLMDNPENPQLAKKVEGLTALKLENLLKQYSELASNPNFDSAMATSKKLLESSSIIGDEEKALGKADLNSLEQYIKTAKETFPNGVKIDPADVTDIMAHFALQPFVIKREKEPQAPKLKI